MAFGELPLLPADTRNLGKAFHQVFVEDVLPLGEFDGVHVAGIFPASPLHVETNNVTITGADDLDGLKFRSSSNTLTETLKLIGVTPILKSAAESYEMLSAGTIDGQATLPAAITGFNTLEFTNNTLLMQGGLGNAITVFAINPAKWAQISEADQAAIMKLGEEMFTDQVSNIYADAEDQAVQEMKDAGYTITHASDELVAALREKVQPVTESWIATAKEAGMEDPAAVLAKYLELANAE